MFLMECIPVSGPHKCSVATIVSLVVIRFLHLGNGPGNVNERMNRTS